MKTIRKITEPLAYIVLIAAFGFLTSVVNHSRSSQSDSDANLMSYSMEKQLTDMLAAVPKAKEISL